MKVLYNIREFFYPILEGEPDAAPNDIKTEELQMPEDGLDEVYDVAVKIFEEEESRKDKIESKASLFIGTTSIITTVTFAATAILYKSESNKILSPLLIMALLVFVIYLTRTIWFSVKALERRAYHSISSADYLGERTKTELQKNLIIKITNNTRRNYAINNEKLDNMVMAQEYYKRAVISFCVYTICLFCYHIIIAVGKSQVDYDAAIVTFSKFTQINGLATFSLFLNICLFLLIIIRRNAMFR